MSSFCGAHRAPRASVDPIDSARDALAVLDLALRRPLVAETVALVLDADRRGRTIVIVDGTVEPDSILDVVERMAESIAAGGRPGALVVATAGPAAAPSPATRTAGSRPATSPTTSASSSSSGS